jgi:spore coat polysaccharide biosynthesis predicted glycosyltransferase SpsG
MNSILFRCDASLQIGSGHVMRCRTLARELRRRDAEITFICRHKPGDLIELLRQEFQVLALPPLAAAASSSPLEGRALYA